MCMEKKREAEFDIAKGILILCVVIGHGGSDAMADFICRCFLFFRVTLCRSTVM